MDQWLRALAVLPGDQVQFSAPTRCLTTICNSISRASISYSGPQVSWNLHGTQMYVQAKHSDTFSKSEIAAAPGTSSLKSHVLLN